MRMSATAVTARRRVLPLIDCLRNGGATHRVLLAPDTPLRCDLRSLCLLIAFFRPSSAPASGFTPAETALSRWGRRIRTATCGNQDPLFECQATSGIDPHIASTMNVTEACHSE